MNNRQRGLFFLRRTQAELQAEGWRVAKCETLNPITRKSQDLFGVADLAAWHPDKGFMLVQVTARAAMSARRKKIRSTQPGIEKAVRFEVWGWDNPKRIYRYKREVL